MSDADGALRIYAGDAAELHITDDDEVIGIWHFDSDSAPRGQSS